MKIEVDLPRIVRCGDYHDFEYLADDIKDHLNPKPKIKVKELGNAGFQYVGVAYVGKMPSKKVINKLLEDAEIELQ